METRDAGFFASSKSSMQNQLVLIKVDCRSMSLKRKQSVQTIVLEIQNLVVNLG